MFFVFDYDTKLAFYFDLCKHFSKIMMCFGEKSAFFLNYVNMFYFFGLKTRKTANPRGQAVQTLINNFLLTHMKKLYSFSFPMMRPTMAPTTMAPIMESQSRFLTTFSRSTVSVMVTVSVRSM